MSLGPRAKLTRPVMQPVALMVASQAAESSLSHDAATLASSGMPGQHPYWHTICSLSAQKLGRVGPETHSVLQHAHLHNMLSCATALSKAYTSTNAADRHRCGCGMQEALACTKHIAAAVLFSAHFRPVGGPAALPGRLKASNPNYAACHVSS